MEASFQCFCPASDSTCPKRGRQIGRYPSIEAAREAQLHHLTHSSYHYMAEDCALALVDEQQDLTIVKDVEHTPVPSSAPPRSPSPHRRRSRSRSPNVSIASVIAHLRSSEQAARRAMMAAVAAAKTLDSEVDKIRKAIDALEQRG